MKKTLYVLVIVLLALCIGGAAVAEEAATVLPFGVSFGMTHEELDAVLKTDSVWESWYEDDDEMGSLSLQNVALGIGGQTAKSLYFQVDRNNSAKAPRMCMLSADLEIEGSVIPAFRKALAAMTELYGQPDADPFGSDGVNGYVEFGSLYASWTKPDVRINLSCYNRMYDETLSVDYTYRLNYDAADLN